MVGERAQAAPAAPTWFGATMMSAVVASPLTGKELEAYYTPLFEKAGCSQMTCTISSRQTDCICHHPDRWGHPTVGRTLTDPGLAMFQVYY